MASVLDPPVQTPASAGRPPARWARRVALGVLIALVAVVLVVALLPGSVWKRLVVGVVSHETGRQAAIDGPIEVHLFRLDPQLIVEGFRLGNADWATQRPMLRVRRFDASVSLPSLLRFALVFPHITVDGPDLELRRDARNRANWDFSTPGAHQPPKPSSAPAMHLPLIKRLQVNDGKLAAEDAIRKLRFEGAFAVAEGSGNDAKAALKLQGRGLLNAKPFDLQVEGDPLLNADSSKPYRLETTVTAADIKLSAQSSIAHPFDLGEVSSTFHVSGKDLADVYYLTGLALPNTSPYDLKGSVKRNNLKFSIDDFKGRLGSSDIEGALVIDTGLARPKLSGDISSQLLDLKDLAAPLGTQASPEEKKDTLAEPQVAHSDVNPASAPQARAGASVAAADPQALRSGYLLPDADLQVNRVRAMDADVRFRAAAIATAKLPMKQVQFHLRLDDGQLTVDPLEFTLPQGRFSGGVTINARNPVPETSIDMKLDQVDLAQFKPKGSEVSPLSGQLLGRVRLRASGSSVHKAAADANGDITFVVPQGQMRSAFAELTGINLDKGLGLLIANKDKETDIRCAVASFQAKAGDLKTRSLLIDTTHVLVTGSGDINLNNEALNLALRGKPKSVRVLRLRSPILVHGTLAHPDVGLATGNIVGQAGAAVALGALLTPLASVLAFVDVGLAKDANCAAVINQAQAPAR